MAGLPASLLKKLRQTLLECGPFDSDRTLLTVFADDRIAPWKNQVSQAYSSRERVDRFVSDFLNRNNSRGQSVLVLFLQAVHDQAIEEDACHQQLDDLAIEVADALGSQLPPLARHNLWRTSAARAGETVPANTAGYTVSPAELDDDTFTVPLPPNLSARVFTESLESLKNKEKADWLPVSFLEEGMKAARAVGRVEYQGRKIGTAFLVTPNLVLTNAHVIKEMPVLEQGGVRFNVELRSHAQWCYFSEQIEGSPIEDLDFALVRLKTAATGMPLTLSAELAYPEQPANILQFPGTAGGLMQVALRYNAIVHVEPRRLYYVTDTERGSSGSPVFNDDWRVIALHRAGIEDEAKRPVKNANQGVPLTAIEPFIRPHLNGG